MGPGDSQLQPSCSHWKHAATGPSAEPPHIIIKHVLKTTGETFLSRAIISMDSSVLEG